MKRNKIVSGILCLLLAVSLVVPTFATDSGTANGLIPQQTTDGQKNIVLRARQLQELRWTPVYDVVGWGNEIIYRAGTTYVGIPYGQPVDVQGYIGYNISIEEFVAAVSNPASRFYSVRSAYSRGSPSYASDCSGFVSYAWGLKYREHTASLAKVAERVADQSINGLQVGDCLNRSSSHAALVSGVWYDAQGNVAAVEIMDQNTGGPRRIYCGPGGKHPLSWITQYYFNGGYVLYRNPDRYNVDYVHSCAVPLSGEKCANCSASAPIAPPEPEPQPTPPTPAPTPGGTVDKFIDVPETAWYANYVNIVCSLGLMNGTGDGMFTPDGTMNRAMFVTVLGRMAGVSADAYSTVPGPIDLEYGQYYTPYVKWAYHAGVLDGVCFDGRFAADEMITREHMCRMLYNFAGSEGVNLPGGTSAPRFSDDSQIAPANKAAVYSLMEVGIISGMGDGSFAPGGSATRAQAAKILGSFLMLIM